MFLPLSEWLIFFHIFIPLDSNRNTLWISFFAGNVTIHVPSLNKYNKTLLYLPRITLSKRNCVTLRLCLHLPPTDVTQRHVLEDYPHPRYYDVINVRPHLRKFWKKVNRIEKNCRIHLIWKNTFLHVYSSDNHFFYQ